MSDAMTILFLNPPPSPMALESALREMGFSLELNVDRASFEGAFGFWPMKLALADSHIETGVEIYQESPSAFFSSQALRVEPEYRHALSLRWAGGGDETLFCVYAISAAFNQISSCVLFDEYHETRLPPSELDALCEYARASLRRLETFYVAQRADWTTQFLTLLRGRDAQYQINPLVRWPHLEVYRIKQGVFEQQSTSTRSSLFDPITIAHSFAVSVHLSDTSDVFPGPFTIGHRSNSGYTIRDAFERDLGAVTQGTDRVRGLQSTHSRRKGYDQIVMECTANAEERLAPLYRSMLLRAAPTLLKCIALIDATPSLLQDELRRKRFQELLQTDRLETGAIAREGSVYSALGSALPEAIACLNHEYLSKYRADLADVAQRLESLLAAGVSE